MSEELFRDFWWLMFPVFGMVMAVLGVVRDGGREDRSCATPATDWSARK